MNKLNLFLFFLPNYVQLYVVERYFSKITDLYLVLPSFTDIRRDLPGLTYFYRVLLSFTKVHPALPSFTDFFRDWPSFT